MTETFWGVSGEGSAPLFSLLEVSVAQWGDHQDRPEREYCAFEAPLRGGQIASSGTRTVYGSPPVPFQRLGEGIVSPYSSQAIRLPWICRGG